MALWLVFVLASIIFINADTIPYNNHVVVPARPEYMVIPKYAKHDVPSWSPGHGRSYIDLSRVSLTLRCPESNPNSLISDACKSEKFQVLMFKAPPDKQWANFWETDDYCCTQDAINNGVCTNEQRGDLIVPVELQTAITQTFTVNQDDTIYLHDSLVGHIDILESGLYVIFMAECDENARSIIINGNIESLDPYGYLPADIFGSLPFYGTLNILYVLLALIWVGVCIYHSNQLISIQFWITAVLALGLLETAMMFSHYLHWNDKGLPAFDITLMGLLFGVTKRALSRVVVQLVALGYGIVRPSIGEDMNRVLALGSAYFLLSLIYTLSTNRPANAKSVDDPEYDMLNFILLIIGCIDTIFYFWIISSINNLLASLAARKQAQKYLLYRNFRAVLFVSLFFTIVWALYGSIVFYNNNSGTDGSWQYRWIVDALWELTYFAVFAAIAFLWAPTENSKRYAYSIELSQLDNDEEYRASNDAHVSDDNQMDNEFGGKDKDNDEDDPFHVTGALDTNMAISKKA